MKAEDFMISPNSGLMKSSHPTENFVFSDHEDDNDSNTDDDAFEDSVETLGDTENPSASNPDLFTPVQLKSAFARTLQANSEAKPTSTPKLASLTPSAKPNKRGANSPLDVKDQKKQKQRSVSQIPKKKWSYLETRKIILLLVFTLNGYFYWLL